ncbi:PREDICTED: WD repeat-containing protein 44-like [Camelina sativa]|uniref:WD repeat-containing protein 44-like n=1 Tax=Camelina sativa TaxID=90675 RepID=A0ABM0X9W3_CAMSA|nr:PREDICTED: WD repeat-containing protein 44-like [Camelina sativa]
MMKMMMMNRRSNVVRFETKVKEEEEEEKDDNDDCFYESLDRVLSSCSCSTSNSDYDSDPNISDSIHDPSPFPVPVFPMGSSGFELWKSEPESVSERRIRLLRGLGLSNEPDLPPPASHLRSRSRRKGICSSHFSRSVPSDVLVSKHQGKCVLRSDAAGSDNVDLGKSRQYTGSRCSCSSPVNMLNDDHTGKSRMRNGGNNGVDVLSKEPTMEIRDNLSHGNGRDVDLDEQMCTIRNLDTGKEFVVNEVREDGMLEKLKEVGTDRQLTIEEFEMCVGTSPIVLELMRRQNVENVCKDSVDMVTNVSGSRVTKHRRRGSWLKSIKNVASSVTGYKERRSTDDRDSPSERGGQRFSSATDDSRDTSFHDPERVKVRQYGKSCKELTALFKSQEIQAHKGSIWSIKFTLDGRYLASAGEDCVIQIWKVVESERKGELLSVDKQEDGSINLFLLANGSPEPVSMSPKRRGRTSFSRKSVSLDNVLVPEAVFGLSEKPVCSFVGHLDDVLDLSWSKSQHLLSSSMDKTVRLWDLSSKTCLKVFSHSDYVTCIQFNPVDDNYFISGSLDAKVRIWSIPDHQVVDWNDLHEMVTAACYTPDGQGALVGSYKGTCCLYNTHDNKLQQRREINLKNRKKKTHHKKITGFQFVAGSSSEVLVTSADSRTRVVDGVDLVHKFKGFRNTNSQISASLTSNGKFLVSASEDSNVYVWNYDSDSRPGKSKRVTVTNSYEHFYCRDVSVAAPWPGKISNNQTSNIPEQAPFTANNPPTPVNDPTNNKTVTNGIISSATNRYFFDRISATWPEEKLMIAAKNRARTSPRVSVDMSNGPVNTKPSASAWSMVIVTGGLRGEIRTFQNFGFPVRL